MSIKKVLQWKRLITFALLVLMSPLAMAASVASSSDLSTYNLFTPPIMDKSVGYLGELFGTVGSVLHGTSGQLLGNVFEVFNYGMLSLAILLVAYSVVSSVIYTASDGDVMGRGTNTAWASLRVVLGIGALVPTSTGYSMVQIFIMWVVIQGVGFADSAWNRALDYLQEGNPIHQTTGLTANDVGMVGLFNERLTCMYKTEALAKAKQREAVQQLKNDPDNVYLQELAKPVPKFKVIDAPNSKAFYFPGTIAEVENFQDKLTVGWDGKPEAPAPTVCGSFQYGKLANGQNSEIIDNPQYQKDLAVVHDALSQVIDELKPAAKRLATAKLWWIDKTYVHNSFLPEMIAAHQAATNAILNATFTFVDKLREINPIWIKGVDGNKVVNNTPAAILDRYYKDAREQGWMMAGRYYYALNNVDKQIKSDSVLQRLFGNAMFYEQRSTDAGIFNTSNSKESKQERLGISDKDVGYSYDTLLPYRQWELVMGAARFATKNAKELTANLTSTFTYSDLKAGFLGTSGDEMQAFSVTQSMFDIVNNVFSGLMPNFAGDQGNDPIRTLQQFGNQLLDGVTQIWGYGTAAIAGISLIGSLGGGFSAFAWVILEIVAWFIPILTAIISAMFTAGVVLAVYIPMMPYILFTFGAIGWLMAVIEAMIAGPLVALGVTHPKGHDWLGKAEQSVMLLLSVFLRPILMIIGLLAAMVMSRIAFSMLNAGFSGVAMDISVEGASAMSSLTIGPITFLAMLVVYTTLVMSLATAAFSLIVVIPDKIMRWLGLQPDQTNIAMEATQAAKGSAQSTGQAMGQSMGGTMQGGAQRGAQNAKEKYQDWKQNKKNQNGQSSA